MSRSVLVAYSIVAASAGCYEDLAFPSGMTLLQGVVYGSGTIMASGSSTIPAGNQTLVLDAYFPPVDMSTIGYSNTQYPGLLADPADQLQIVSGVPFRVDPRSMRPAIVLIHGGSFGHQAHLASKTSDGDNVPGVSRKMVAHGFVAIGIEYRQAMTGDVAVTQDNMNRALLESVEDARAAVRFVRSKSSLWKIDTNKIAIGGDSAGGQAALAYGYLSTNHLAEHGWSGLQTTNAYSSGVQLIVAISASGNDDLIQSIGTNGRETPLALITGGSDPHMRLRDVRAISDAANAHPSACTGWPYNDMATSGVRFSTDGPCMKSMFTNMKHIGHVPDSIVSFLDDSKAYFGALMRFAVTSMPLTDCPSDDPNDHRKLAEDMFV